MSTGRVLWIIWCCAWAGLWAVAAAAQMPRHGCVMPMLLVINGQACAQWGMIGSLPKMAVFAVLALAALAAVALPVGRSSGQ